MPAAHIQAQRGRERLLMSRALVSLVTAASLTLSACGGDSGGTASGGGGSSSGGTTTTAGCSLVERQNWAFAQLNEWYLFPETLPSALSPAAYSTVDDYIDALTATARSQRRDRFFTYLTSIREENAFNSSGSSAGIGIRLSTDATTKKALVSEAFEGAPGLASGLDRGTEIVAIGDTPASLRTVNDIITAEGTAGVTAALGPTTAGVTRTLRITNGSGTSTVTVTKADYALTPVSVRYGAQIIDDAGKRVGYLNLRTFISSADPQLRTAFNDFRAAGITEFIIDFRYNGGGLVSTADLLGDLLGGNRSTFDVFSQTTYRPEKSSRNSTKRFGPLAQSVSPVKIAFIGTGATASASELVINSFVPYLGANVALIGANTFGKPVGQVALDRAACDDRLRAIAFSLRNSANSDAYYDGLATAVRSSCAASDDVTKPLGDAQEASVRQALDFLAGKACAPIPTGQTARSVRDSVPQLLRPEVPTVSQREVPGLF
jgi:carboxyl-terminal processing protease